MRDSKKKAKKSVGGGEKIAIAVQTAVVDVAASGEFCNQQRRVAHLLGHVRLHHLRRHHGDHGVRLSDAGHADAARGRHALVHRRA